MGLLRTIFIIVLVYYVVKVLSRMFAPFMLKYAAKKAEERFGGQFKNQRQQQEAPKKEGEITIDKIPNIKTSNKDVGDYVDYEEVE